MSGNNYAKPIPFDKNQVPMQSFPAPVTSQTRYMSANANLSSVISLQPNTTEVEIAAVNGAGVAIKWIPTTDTVGSVISSGATANFDHFVPGNTFRQFVVPKETQGLGTAPMQIGSTYGLYQRLAVVNGSSTVFSSVLVSEF